MKNGSKGYALLLIIKQFTKFPLLLPFAAYVNVEDWAAYTVHITLTRSIIP